MGPIMALRKQYAEKFEKAHGVRLGFMGFFVKAACAALQKFPVINASVDGNDIVYHGYIDIGIAVGSPRGLVVPIIRNADQMTIAEIEKKIAEFGVKAKDGKLSIEDLTGGTFSISNGGIFGSMMSTPIINPPPGDCSRIRRMKPRACGGVKLPMLERAVDRTEVYLADEIFFVGNAAEITPVAQVDGQTIGDGAIGPITRRLRADLDAIVRGTTPDHAPWRTAVGLPVPALA